MRGFLTAGLDVGTAKVAVVAAEVTRKGIRLLGAGITPSVGIKKGIVVNMDATVDSISDAVKEAEAASGIRIKSACVSFSGPHIRSLRGAGTIGIKGREITGADIARAVGSAKTVYVPLDREIIHTIPTEFVVDGQEGIVDPKGMCGTTMEARVQIITGAASPVQNLLKCCERAGMGVKELVFEALASAHSTLSPEEKESGTVLADIGGGTTGIAFFRGGCLRHAGVVGIGGNHFTNDIAVGLKSHFSEAERIKKDRAAAYPGLVPEGEEVSIRQPDGQERLVPARCISEILQPRCEELLELIGKEIDKAPGEAGISGVVFTGGSSLLKGLEKLAESAFGLPVRTGLPGNMRAITSAVQSPSISAAVGLACYDSEHLLRKLPEVEGFEATFSSIKTRFKKSFINKSIHYITGKEGGVLCLKSKK